MEQNGAEMDEDYPWKEENQDIVVGLFHAGADAFSYVW